MEIRLGIAGLGWGARMAAAMRDLPGVTLPSCHARTPAARDDFAARFGCRACATWEELVADDSLHGVIIMTPNRTHRDLAVAALRAGKHVLVTKPVATTLRDAADMIAAAREGDRILAVGHQSRRHPALRELKRLVEAGDLGAPRLVEGNTSSPTGLSAAPDEWRAQAEECPGGPLLQLGIHYVDNYQHLLGPVGEVTARFSKLGRGAIDPDTAIVLFGFDAGSAGSLTSSYVTPHTRWIRVTGEHAMAQFGADGSLTLQPAGRGPCITLMAPVKDREETLRQMLAEEVAEFAECIRTGRAPETDGIAGARNLAVVLAAVASHRRGAPVRVQELWEKAGLSGAA